MHSQWGPGASSGPRLHPSFHRVPRGLTERMTDGVNLYAGSLRFVRDFVVTTVVWCVAGQALGFDRWPYPLFTWAVSVLAILLSTLILIAGNRQAALDRAHQDHAFEQIELLWRMQQQQLQILERLEALD